MMKKLLALLLAVMMVFSLAACSSSSSDDDDTEDASSEESEEESEDEEEEESEEESEDTEAEEEEDLYYNTTGYPICDEEIEITVAGQTPSGLDDWTQLAVVDEYAKRLGIRIVDCFFYDSDSWPTQLTLMIASDDLPDMLINGDMNISDIITWGDEGYFLDMNEYIDLMPNMVSYFEEYPDLESFVTTTEGSIYGIARIKTDITDRISRTFINQIWLDNVGLEVPTSIDELYEALTAFYEQDANGNGDSSDEIPYLYSPDIFWQSECTIMNGFGIPVQSENTYVLEATTDGEVLLANTTTEYQAYLSFMAQLYQEGLIEQEAYTITSDEASAKTQDDLYGFFGCGSAPFVLLDSDKTADANWAMIVSLTSEYNEDGDFAIATTVSSDILLAISATTAYPEALCRFVDYFYTEEGIYAAVKGYEGVSFDYVYFEELGCYKAEMRCPDGYDSSEQYRYTSVVFNESLNVIESNPDRDVLFTLDDETLMSDTIIESYGWASMMAQSYNDAIERGATMIDGYPRVAYTSEQSEIRDTYYTDITTYLDTSKAQFITGEMDVEADWDTYLSNLESMGLEELLAVEQEAYNNYLAVIE